jgi:uncharacterized protein YyaL (SSP411 family)
MNAACSKAFMATGIEAYKQLAIDNIGFIKRSFKNHSKGEWHHSYKSGAARHPAFLDDLAFLIQAMILLQEITGEANYLKDATEIADYVIAHFSDEEGPYFYFTNNEQKDVIVRKKEIYDGATPSENARWLTTYFICLSYLISGNGKTVLCKWFPLLYL